MSARRVAVLFGLGSLAHAIELQGPFQMHIDDVDLPHGPVDAVFRADGVGGLVLRQGELVEPQRVIALTDAVMGALEDHVVLDASGQGDLGVHQVL